MYLEVPSRITSTFCFQPRTRPGGLHRVLPHPHKSQPDTPTKHLTSKSLAKLPWPGLTGHTHPSKDTELSSRSDVVPQGHSLSWVPAQASEVPLGPRQPCPTRPVLCQKGNGDTGQRPGHCKPTATFEGYIIVKMIYNQMSINGCVDKQNAVCLYNGILAIQMNSCTDSCYSVDGP